MSDKPKKRFFANHAKSSALLVSLVIHAILVVVAISFVAVTVIQKEDKQFEAKQVVRPQQKLKKLQVPVKMKKRKPKPKLRKRLVAKNLDRKVPEIQMPEITGIKGGIGAMGGDGGAASIGFTMPEIDFFGAKASGEKVVFVVHFGPATIGRNPFSRMTGLTIRKRLEDMVNGMPEYTLFNVACYWMNDTWAMEPNIMLATPANKQKVMDWMAPVNPLEGEYAHCFSKSPKSVGAARGSYPKKVDKLPFYATKWAFPYVVPSNLEQKYLSDAKKGYVHWGRGVAWAILEQKADTIFVLTTNYIDGWGGGGNPSKITSSYKKMCLDVYGPDKKLWPTINVVVLAKAGKDSTGANNVLNSKFGPVVKGFRGDGSVIDDITDYMTDDEKVLMRKYRTEYENEN